MTINLNGYEVKLTARYEGHDKANASDTKAIINLISLYAGAAADLWGKQGCPTIAGSALKDRDALFNELERRGYYE